MQVGDREQRVEDCRRLYLKYGGKRHELIEAEMRELGYANFHRRIMYSRFERQRHRPGWIERYAFAAGTAGTLACEDATASCEAGDQAPSAEQDRQHRHAGGTGVAGKGACVPASDPFAEFQEWLKAVSPGMTWDWKHQVHIYKKLRKVTEGKSKRLMIFMPPRHGKSELVTVRYTAWRLKQDPKMNVILACYNQQLANRFSRKIKGVLADDFALTAKSILTAETQRRGEEEDEKVLSNKNIGLTKTADNNDKSDLSSQRLSVSAVKIPANIPGGPQPMFPFTSNKPKNTEAEWETAVGGGLRAVGVGGGVTGFGANLIVIDDPIKSRAQAESATMREKVWNWFNDDIYTRLEPDGQIVLIQTRWHEDDLAGRLLREEGDKWEVVNLPALAEEESEPGAIATGSPEHHCPDATAVESRNAGTLACPDATASIEADNHGLSAEQYPHHHAGGTGVAGKGACVPADPLGRRPGEALCPERYDVEYLNDLKQKIGTYSFASLYQQRPVPAEGGLFKRKWFENKIISFAPPGLKWKRGTDPGVSAGEKADYTASYRIAIDHDQNVYIDGGFRKQIEYPELRKFILGRIKTEPDTIHAIELSANGTAIYQDLLREPKILGRAFRGIHPKGDKVSRALPWQARAEAGKVYLIRSPLNHELINELCSFPMGTHDDQIDAISLAYNLATETQNNKLYATNYR